MTATTDGPEALAGIVDVSRETIERLAKFADLVRKWQPAENLVGPATLPALWRRHIADSAQIVALFPQAKRFLDLGSGAGFPGLVIAIVANAQVDLIEANRRKSAFLREAIRVTGARAKVHEGRVETVLADWNQTPDVVTARALAPLNALLSLAEAPIRAGARGLFHKGRDHQRETEEAAANWDFDLEIHRSQVDSDGVILEISRLAPKAAR